MTSSGLAVIQPIFQPVSENVLPAAADGDRALPHAGEGREGDVLALEDEVLVDLVGHDQEVAFARERGDGRQLVPGEHGAGRVVRGVEQDQPGAGRHGGAQLVEVEPVGALVGPEGDGDAGAARQGDAGGVRVVVRLQGDDLVAGLQEGQQGGGDRLRGAGGDQELGVGVVLQSVVPPLVVRDRGAQFGDAGARWVLVAVKPARRARTAASRISSGPSVSGNPWPRLIDPVRTASADISAKIVVPNSLRRRLSNGRPCVMDAILRRSSGVAQVCFGPGGAWESTGQSRSGDLASGDRRM